MSWQPRTKAVPFILSVYKPRCTESPLQEAGASMWLSREHLSEGWGGGNCAGESPLPQLESLLYCQGPRGICTGGETPFIRPGLTGPTRSSCWEQLRGENPDRYFYFMQFHFWLNFSDPLILPGTLFPYDVKALELKILFSFKLLETEDPVRG